MQERRAVHALLVLQSPDFMESKGETFFLLALTQFKSKDSSDFLLPCHLLLLND